jgi:hypothetical protein
MFLAYSLGILAGAGHFDAAAFAAASGVNLRLDDDAACALGKQFAGHRGCFFERVGHFAPGHGNAVFCQDFFCLILVNFQSLSPPLLLLSENSGPQPTNVGAAIPRQQHPNTILLAE